MTASFDSAGFENKDIDQDEAQTLMSILSLTLHNSYPDSSIEEIAKEEGRKLPKCPKAFKKRQKKKHIFNS